MSDSFVFYASFKEALELVPDEEYAGCVRCVLVYRKYVRVPGYVFPSVTGKDPRRYQSVLYDLVREPAYIV